LGCDFIDRIGAYSEGEVERHLGVCPDCQQQAEFLYTMYRSDPQLVANFLGFDLYSEFGELTSRLELLFAIQCYYFMRQLEKLNLGDLLLKGE
jgi:hypothetical protein